MSKLLLALLLCSALIVGCGGGSNADRTAVGTTQSVTAPASPSASTGAKAAGTESSPGTKTQGTEASVLERKLAAAHPQLGSPSAVRRTKGGDNSVQDFGSEAPADERQAAAGVLVTYLNAYASGDAATACALLGSSTKQMLVQAYGQAAAQGGAGAPRSCEQLLKALTSNVPDAAKRQLTQAKVLSLRVDGDRGFLLYDGARGDLYSMPMVRESGSWRVAALAGSALPL